MLPPREVKNGNPQPPKKLNFLICCVAGGHSPSPQSAMLMAVVGRRWSFFCCHAFGTNFAYKGGGDATSSLAGQKIKKLSFLGGGCIFYTFAPCGSRRHASKKFVAKMRVLCIGFSRSCRNRVGTIGTALETVVETVVNYIETVEFLYWRPDLDPLDQKITVSMWFTTVSTKVSRAVPTVPTRFLQLLEKPI